MKQDKELIHFVRMKEFSLINLSRGRFLKIHFPTQGDTPSSFALGYDLLALQAGKTFASKRARLTSFVGQRVSQG